MTVLGPAEGFLGGLLLFFVPGYFVTKAVFPEWRVRGREAARRLVEVVTLSFVTSIGLTVIVGYGLLSLAPGGFAAAWSDPVLESCLAVVALVAAVVAVARGAFARVPPTAPAPGSTGVEEGAWELSRELERLGRDERRLEHELRVHGSDASERTKISAELESVRAEKEAVRRRREEEYVA
ncbi:MAG TPA: DUF1616 domain-containing protein [Thermoplasmata archaeon]|nr:DUF1616 domain-containing protein [Thermoplasmata archaeon]